MDRAGHSSGTGSAKGGKTSTVGVQSAATPGRGGDTAGREDAAASWSAGAAGSDDDDGDGGAGAGASRYSISARAVTLKQSRDGACRFGDGGHDSSVGTEVR